MRVLVLSNVYPNPKRPAFGIFIHERMRRVARHADLRVVAPIPWFPANAAIRGPHVAGLPAVEERDGVCVLHPRFFCIPRVAKWLDGGLYAASLAPVLVGLRRRFPFDVVDAHFAYPDGVAAVLLGGLFSVPVVITLRGSIVRLSGYPLHRPQLRFALRRAQRVIAVSRSLKAVAVGLGIPPDKIRVIPNGVDALRFRPLDRHRARAACQLPPGRRVLLSVGGVYAGKGHHLALQAVASLRARHPDLLYVMVGGEPAGDGYAARLRRDVAAAGLSDHVRFAGPRSPDELPLWYAAADLFCLATRSEGWANVLLESIACGVPVVTTRVGGNAEIVRDGLDGYLVPHGDVVALAGAIERALARNWDRTALIDHARRHDWEQAGADAAEELERAVLAAGDVPAAVRAGRGPRP
jgi:glycosyltransferase involved in cell wall biosynthesis